MSRSMEKIVLLARSGDQEAIAELYEQSYNSVYQSVRAIIKDEDEALDIVQDDDGTWLVDGPWLQQLMANVNFGDYESRNWFDRMLRQSGLFDKLEEMGIQDGDIVSLYNLEFEYQR